MKPSFLPVLFFVILIRPLHAQDPTLRINQVMIANSYITEYVLDSRIVPGHPPLNEKIISLHGRSQDTCHLVFVQLVFSSDALNNTKPPVYDYGHSSATAWFPIEQYDSYLEMLKQKKGAFKVTFLQSPSLDSRRVFISNNGTLPIPR